MCHIVCTPKKPSPQPDEPGDAPDVLSLNNQGLSINDHQDNTPVQVWCLPKLPSMIRGVG